MPRQRGQPWWYSPDRPWYPGWTTWGIARPAPAWWGRPEGPPEVVAEAEVPIRPDGTVDSIQLVKGIDEQLDANSITAFSQWKFEPATREGQPVPLEAIVHIPFRGPGRP